MLRQLLLFFSLSLATANAEVQTFGVLGDAGAWNDGAQAVRASMISSRIHQLILPGDNLYDSTSSYDKIWQNWSSNGFLFSIVALGNHMRTYSEEMAYFHMPAEYYSKVIGQSRFLILNSDNEDNADEQTQWLAHELADAREKFVFVVFHHPPYTISNFHHWTEKRRFHEKFRTVLAQYQGKITALLAGHDHVASLIMLNDLPMVISGAVQEQRAPEWKDYIEGPVHVKTLWTYRGNPSWARIDADDSSGEVWINYVNAPTTDVACSVRISPRPILVRDNCRR